MSAAENKAVFLSYASQDAEAAKKICEALRAAGVEVWFDQSELVGGDAWDQKIRKQIKECALFVPVISANTQARTEGYFRLEWRLADQRSHLMAKGRPFLLPVAIDAIRDSEAHVPDSFLEVQWTRLSGGETPPAFAERVRKMLATEVEVGRPLGAVGLAKEARPVQRDGDVASPTKGRPAHTWLAPAMIGAAAVVALAIWQPWRKTEKQSATAPASSPAPSPSNGVSDTRQLVAKARGLFDALDSTRDDFKLAGELLAQAKAKDSTDAEVWAAEAQLDERYIIRGWDGSDERRETARAAAQRALRLDPQSFEVRFAQAQLLAYTGREGTERERILRGLYGEQPTDHRVLRELGSTIERQGRTDEGIVFMDEAAALPGGDPLALYNKSLAFWFVGRTGEAETTLRAAIAQKPFTGALLMSAWYAMVLHGDLAGARAVFDHLDQAELLEDRGCFFAYFLHSVAREPDAALARLAAVPRDWLNDNWYRGPKGRLMGNALQLAGRPEAAAAEWRAALNLVGTRLATDPTNGTLLYNRVLLLGSLGEREEAARQFAVLLQMSGLDLTHDTYMPPWVTFTCVLLGRKDDAIRLIAHSLEQKRHAVDFTAAILRLDPLLDPLRGDPEFQKLIAEADTIEKSAAQAAAPRPKP